MRTGARGRPEALALPLTCLPAYSVGGMHSMLLKWVERGMEIPSEERIAKLKTGLMSDDIGCVCDTPAKNRDTSKKALIPPRGSEPFSCEAVKGTAQIQVSFPAKKCQHMHRNP